MTSPSAFILTPDEAHRLTKRLSKAGLPMAIAPKSEAASSTSSSSASASSAAAIPADTTLTSSAFWLRDERLPKTTRTAIRAGLLAAMLQSTLQGLGAGVRERSPIAFFKKFLTPASFRLFSALAIYSALYRVFLQALLIVRRYVLANIVNFAPQRIRRELSQEQSARGVDERTLRARLFARLIRLLKSRPATPILAGLLASPSLLLLPETFPAASLGLSMFTDSLCASYNDARDANYWAVRWVPDWVDSSLLYALGNGQLLWAFLFETGTFPKNYGNLILSRSKTYIAPAPSHLPSGVQWPSPQTLTQHVAILATPKPTSPPFPTFTSPLLSSLTPSRHPTTPYAAINPVLDYSPAHPAHTNLMCAMLHPKEPSCRQTIINHFKNEWVACAKFAGAFTAAASLILRRKRWAKDPETELFNVVVATLQGATVISGSIGTAWAMTCLLQQYLPRTFLPRARFFINGFMAGIFILLVPKHRRQQLGMYVGRMSIVSSWSILEKQGRVRSPSYGPAALIGVALALVAGLYEGKSEHLSGFWKAVAKRLHGDSLVEGSLDSNSEPTRSKTE